MPEIIPNQTFKDNGKTYEEGQKYEVSEGEAFYFQRCGWVGPRVVNSSTTTTLEVHDGTHGHESEVK